MAMNKSDSSGSSRRDALRGSYFLSRIVFLRALSLIYAVAFLIALNQNKELIGDRGLLPLRLHLKGVADLHGQSCIDRVLAAPTLLWAAEPWTQVNPLLDGIAVAGLTISIAILYSGAANMVALTSLWVLYHSIVAVGQTWYSFGWESQLLETGFLAIWSVPLLALNKVPKDYATPWGVVLGYRWLVFRIMLGAGLIKIRGDSCWRDLTCMNYFYETQPVPNPITYFAHQTPELFHKIETLGNHFVELIGPILMLIPWRPMVIAAGAIQIGFQLTIVLTGNLSFLNWLTMVPCIYFFDDYLLQELFDSKTIMQVMEQVEDGNGDTGTPDKRESINGGNTDALHADSKNNVSFPKRAFRTLDPNIFKKSGDISWTGALRSFVNMSVFALLAKLSVPVVVNLASRNQAMNTSFDAFRLVNTYGAFGSVTKERTEVVIVGTNASNPNDPRAIWLEYEFHCKPGDVNRRPCLISPYHYRLDWLMWFAAFQSYHYNPWLLHLMGKLLTSPDDVKGLIAFDPFSSSHTVPKFVKAQHFSYKLTRIGDEDAIAGRWWKRQYISDYVPPIAMEHLRPVYDQMGWAE